MRRALLILLAVIVVVPLLAIGAAAWLLDDAALKARLAEQVRRETGRTLTIAGPIGLAWSLEPTLELRDVSLSNPPGFSRPAMAHVDRLRAQVALWPLLRRRVEVERIALAGPDVQLERDAQGRPNWVFTPPAAPPATTSAAPAAAGPRFQLSVGRIDISDARIGWNGLALTAPLLELEPASGRVDGSVAIRGTTLALSGTAGPIAGAVWPVDLHLTGGGVAANLAGTSEQAALSVTAPDLSKLSAVAGTRLPSLRDVALSGVLSGSGTSALRLHVGAGAWGGLRLDAADLTAPALGAPASVKASVSAGRLPLTVTGQVGSIAALLAGSTPVDLRADAPGLLAQATGTIAAAGTADLRLGLHAADLGAVGAQAALTLPAFRDLAVDGQLVLSPGSAAWHGLRLTSAEGDLSGDVSLAYAGRPTLRGALTTKSLDLAALLPAPAEAPAPAPAPTQAAPASPAPQPGRVIPDLALPLDALLGADADLQLTAAQLLWHGRPLRAVQTHALLQNGTLHLDPLSLAVGPATAKATVAIDAAASPPTLALTMQAPDLPAGPAFALFGGPPDAPGTVGFDADLRGAGATTRAVAASLTGTAGLAIVDSEIENTALERLAAEALRSVDLPLEAGGVTKLRCAALLADAAGGVVQVRALALDTSKLTLDGTGTVNLGDESLDLHLQPLLRLGGGLSVPVRLRGSLAAPRVALDPGAIAPGRVGIVLGGAAPADVCGPALALARNGKAGPMPATAPAPARAVKPADLLRGLLR